MMNKHIIMEEMISAKLKDKGFNNTNSLPTLFDKRPQKLNPVRNVETSFDKTYTMIIFCKDNTGGIICHRLDFSSPRTMKAGKELGISFSDCIYK